MEKRTIVIGTSILVLMTTCFSQADGTSIKKMSLEQLTTEASDIAIGTVTNLEGREVPFFEQTEVFTYVALNVEQWIKGSSQAKELVFRYPGGRVGDRGAFMVGAPTVTTGEKVLVFLASDPRLTNATLEVVGLVQGRYVIRGDRAVQPETRKERSLPDFINEIQTLIADAKRTNATLVEPIGWGRIKYHMSR